MRLSELRTMEELDERDLADPEYRAEQQRTRLANEVAVFVLRYRAEHHLTQAAFGRLIGIRQPHVARLEAGKREPSLQILAKLSAALSVQCTIDISRTGVQLRQAA